MKPSILGLFALTALLLPAESGLAQASNTFNSNFSALNNDWTSASNWVRVGGGGGAPITALDKAFVSGFTSTRTLVVNGDGIHVRELEYIAGPGTETTQRIAANGTRSVKIDNLTHGGSYTLSINNGTGDNSLSVEIGNLNFSNASGGIEIGHPSIGSLDGFKVTGTSTIAGSFAYNGVMDRVAGLNRIELGDLVVLGSGTLTLGGRGNSNGTVEVSSLSGGGIVQVAINSAHSGVAGTLLIDSENTTPVTFSGLLRDTGNINYPAVLTVVKSGSGTQVFSQSSGNSYSCITTIDGGVLAVTNTSGGGLGSGSVNVLDGGILAGSGIIAPGSGKKITIQAGGSIAPSAHLETGFANLRLNGADSGIGAILDMEEGSSFTFRLGADDAADRISFINYHAGGLALFGGGIAVNGVGVQEGAFTLFTFDTISETELDALLGRLQLGGGFGGYLAAFSAGGNSILLEVSAIPEPGLTSLLGVASVVFAAGRLRRKILG